MDENLVLHGLNTAQSEAVTSDAAVLQVLAPPGSGKTKTLTARVAYLIAQKQLRPWNIIVCTFTVKAANEMKERITGFIGPELAKQLKLGTFHSISLRYLKQYGQHIGLDKDFGIADSSDSKAIIKRIIKQNGFSIEPGQARGRISSQKAKGIDAEHFLGTAKDIEKQEFAKVYLEYEEALRVSNLLDYDDLLLRCSFLLKSHPQCVSNVEALLIDEFQDTNNIQYDLMSLFAQRNNVITIVGDPDQSIYGFRNAEIKNLTRMKKQWPDTMTINLEENYRSSGAILHAAQHIIEQDESRPPKKLQATHSLGMRPMMRRLPSAAAEADWLVSEVQRTRAMTGNMLKPSDYAVLLRSAALSRVIESAMGKAGVPYRMMGGTRFYDRVEVKLLVDYLRVIHQSGDNEAVERTVNMPARRIGAETIKSLQEEASQQDVCLWQLIVDVVQGRRRPSTKLTEPTKKGLAAFVNVILSGQRKAFNEDASQGLLVDLLNLVLKKLAFQDWLKKKYPEDHEVRWQNVEELIAQATDASNPERLQAMLEEQALPEIEGLEQRSASTLGDTLSLFLSNIALTSASEAKAEQNGEKVEQLTISTIHAAKGLEWPVVFIPACYDGSIPHSRSDDNDEERRLLYVGMTRAQALLYLSCPVKNTQREETAISTFLAQPGVSTFFEEHGPSLPLQASKGLAATLRRDCPSARAIDEAKQDLERDEDNYWPLNGEQAPEELAKWDHGRSSSNVPAAVFSTAAVTMQQQQGFSTATATLKPGFTSVSEKYEELMEEARMKSIDKRSEQAPKPPPEEKPKGRKRQIEGQGTIQSFFNKRNRPEEEQSSHKSNNESVDSNLRSSKQPLQEVHNFQPSSTGSARATRTFHPSNHKPRTAPLHPKPALQATRNPPNPHNDYMFLSSSPPPAAEKNEDESAGPVPEPDPRTDTNADEPTSNTQSAFQPASTLHTTSVQRAAAAGPQPRRTLGVKMSFNGWANRGGKR
ncbi:UvrD-helicase-domain-containing protein [Hortaea werneckii]|nr:UvrD-helicase-domain-containing protein [Hortaea werneckii]KAI7325190.1 UvrD-helicase-domain-containing protein [Hortaea werneckii]